MRTVFVIFLCVWVFQANSQTPVSTLISGVIAGPDSIPIPGAVIINTRTSHAVRTDARGFFQTEITGDDSLFVHHISYKKRFINEKSNGKIIILEPQVNEIGQVDIIDDGVQNMKNLQQTMEDIKRMAPEKKFEHSDYTEGDRQARFVKQNGSHEKGFKEFFGPTTHLPLERIIASVAGTKDNRERKKLTSHYHLVKRKGHEKEK